MLHLTSSERTRELQGFHTLLASCYDNYIIYCPDRAVLQVKGAILKTISTQRLRLGISETNQNMEPNSVKPTTASPGCCRAAPFGNQCSFPQTSFLPLCSRVCILCHCPPSPYVLEEQNHFSASPLFFTLHSYLSIKLFVLSTLA